MSTDEDSVDVGKAIAAKLVEAIKKDRKINSMDCLSSQAVMDNLPAICMTVIEAIADNDLSLLATCESNQGSQHGVSRSRQNVEPEEIVREFFLLKQIIIAKLKPQLIDNSPEKIIERVALIDRAIDRVIENSFKSYTEVKKQQLQKLQQQIILTNQDIAHLIAEHQDSLSYLLHEIKNPLTAIIGYSDLFIRQQKASDTSISNLQHIQQVLQQGRNILRLLNDTLNVSCCSLTDFQLRIKQFDIRDLISNIVWSLKATIEQKNIALIVNYFPEQIVVKSDYLRLQQIITNLLNNAVRYTKKGKIELTCRKTASNYLEIKVADTGVGISSQEIERVFDPYFRSQKSQENVPEGIGMGLTIVSQLVNILEGNIELTSDIDVGSVFIVTIPLNIEQE